MAKSIKFKKSRGEQLGAALGTAAMLYGGYKMGEQKGLWGGNGEGTPEEQAALAAVQKGAKGKLMPAPQQAPAPVVDRTDAANPQSSMFDFRGGGIEAPAQPSPTRAAAARRAAATSTAMSDAPRGVISSAPPMAPPGVQSYSTPETFKADSSVTASGRGANVVVNPGGTLNGYGVTQGPSQYAKTPAATPVTRSEAVSNALRLANDPTIVDARDLALRQVGMADGGSVGSCEPSRSARSFPKKGK